MPGADHTKELVGGFTSEVDEPIMISQVELRDVRDPAAASKALLEKKESILPLASRSGPPSNTRSRRFRKNVCSRK